MDELENTSDNIETLKRTVKDNLNYERKLKASLKDWKDSAMRLNEEKKMLKETIKETKRVLNSAKNHYTDEKTNWAIERALRVLERGEKI